MNQTGVKWLGTPDLAKYLQAPENSWTFIPLFTMAIFSPVIYYFSAFVNIKATAFNYRKFYVLVLTFASLGIYCYKLNIEIYFSRISCAQFVYFCILALAVTSILDVTYQSKRMPLLENYKVFTTSLLIMFRTLCVLLQKPHNAIIFFCMDIITYAFVKYTESQMSTLLSMLWLGYFSFFCFGKFK